MGSFEDLAVRFESSQIGDRVGELLGNPDPAIKNESETQTMATPKTTTNGNGNGSDYSKTVNAATGGSGGAADAGEAELMVIGDVSAMFSSFTPADLTQIAKSGKVEFAPQAMRIGIGKKVEGFLEGEGPGNDFTDPVTGAIRHVRSWIIRAGVLRVSILSSVQLDKKLAPFIGARVGIARDEDIMLAGGHRCANYYVWGEPAADGKPRSFVTLPGQAQAALPAPIDAQATEHVNHETAQA